MASGLRLRGVDLYVVVLAPEARRSTTGDEVLQQGMTVNGGRANERRREKHKRSRRSASLPGTRWCARKQRRRSGTAGIED
jgi:Trm5-related predicted tRNA methylase